MWPQEIRELCEAVELEKSFHPTESDVELVQRILMEHRADALRSLEYLAKHALNTSIRAGAIGFLAKIQDREKG